MSAAQLSLKDLAERALPMPWDTVPSDVPFASRHAFRDAITPQVFLETVKALERLSAQAERLRPSGSAPTEAEKNAVAVLAMLTGSAS